MHVKVYFLESEQFEEDQEREAEVLMLNLCMKAGQFYRGYSLYLGYFRFFS